MTCRGPVVIYLFLSSQSGLKHNCTYSLCVDTVRKFEECSGTERRGLIEVTVVGGYTARKRA